MPASVVRTERDEHLWSRAKEEAKKQGRTGDYAYVMGIFKRMKGEKSMDPNREPDPKLVIKARKPDPNQMGLFGGQGSTSRSAPVRSRPKPPGSGWQMIPGGKKGGYRRKRAKGYEYWYPETGIVSQDRPRTAAPKPKDPTILSKLPPDTHIYPGSDRISSWNGIAAVVYPPMAGDFDPKTMTRPYTIHYVEDPSRPGRPLPAGETARGLIGGWQESARSRSGNDIVIAPMTSTGREIRASVLPSETVQVRTSLKEMTDYEHQRYADHLRSDLDYRDVSDSKGLTRKDWQQIVEADSYDELDAKFSTDKINAVDRIMWDLFGHDYANSDVAKVRRVYMKTRQGRIKLLIPDPNKVSKSLLHVTAGAATAAARRGPHTTTYIAPKKQPLGQRLSIRLGRRPPGSGWQPIPGGSKGGFRKRSGGQWVYWYPGMRPQGGSETEAERHLAAQKRDGAMADVRRLNGEIRSLTDRAGARAARGDLAGARRLRERAHGLRDQVSKLRQRHGLAPEVASISKAERPPGSGWGPIPGGRKRGGLRRPRGSGYEYWYPGMGVQGQPHADDKPTRAAKQPKGKPEAKKPAARPEEKPKKEAATDKPKRKGQSLKEPSGRAITDPSQLPPDFNDLPKNTRAFMTADYDVVTAEMNERFGAMKGYSGDLDKAISDDVDEMAKHGWIVPANAQRAKDMLAQQLEWGRKAGISDEDLAEVMETNVRKLAHQETEASRRTLGDHGVRHLAVNAEQVHKIFDELDRGGIKISPMQRFMGSQVMIDHDMGYTIPAIAKGGFAVKDNYHPQASTLMVFQQREPFQRIFGGEEQFNKYVGGVANHSGSIINWKADPFGSAVRLADNTHLFADKMPEVLFDSTAAVNAMVKLRLASELVAPTLKVTDEKGKEKLKRTPEEKAQFKELVAGIKAELSAEIQKRDDLPHRTREALLLAVRELGELTPKFLISRLAGRSPEFKFDAKTGDMSVQIEQSGARETIGRVFGDDEEDKQFVKLLKDYGVTPEQAINAKPPPPHARVAQRSRGGAVFKWGPPKDQHPAERRHAEAMDASKSEFERIRGMSEGPERDAATRRFFGLEAKVSDEKAEKSVLIGTGLYDTSFDKEIAGALASGELQVGVLHRHHGDPSMQPGEAVLEKGTIIQGEAPVPTGAPPPGHASESEVRARVEAAIIEADPDGTRGQGGLADWFASRYDDQLEARPPMVMKAMPPPPPTKIIDTDDPHIRAMERTNPMDTGARTAIDQLRRK
jgi:hypothetical protein